MLSEHISRLKMMADPEQQKWDLSPNDQEAIRTILERLRRAEELLGIVREHTNCDEVSKDRVNLGGEIGRFLKG